MQFKFQKMNAPIIIAIFLGSLLFINILTQANPSTTHTIGGQILYVGGTGPGNYTKIQKAINVANNGDIIYVYNGHYYEQILINKTISLIGENQMTTFLNSYFYSTVISVTSPNVTIIGFTIQNSSTHPTNYYAGVKGLADNLYLYNLKIVNNGIGILLQNSNGHHLQSCQFYNNGLYVDNATNNIVKDCQVNQKPLVYLEDSNSQHITNAGQVIINKCNNISVDTVSLTNATIGMQIHNSFNVSLKNSSISNNSFGGIICTDSDANYISQCNFGDNRYIGIRYTNVHNANCSNSTFSQGSSVHILDSSEIRVYKNTIIDVGISLKNSSYCSIDDNILYNQSWGISLYSYSHHNQINRNIFENSFGSIRIEEYSTYNYIHQNHLIGGYIGIELFRYSTDNIFIENIIQDTQQGIDIQFGCNSNHFIKNHFQNNSAQGMSIEHAEQQHLINNTFVNNGLSLSSTSYHTITGNTVNGLPLIYKQMESDCIISDAGQIILVTCTDITIENLTIAKSTNAVQILDCSNIIIRNSNFSNNNRGIILIESTENIIDENHFVNNTRGIDLQNSKKNLVTNNSIFDGKDGISLTLSPRNYLFQNTISDHDYYGIHIIHSNRNLISHNTAIRNNIGVLIDDYIEWLTSFSLTSQRNTIEHNNLYDNYEHNGYFENGLLNSWDGNYYKTSGKINIIPGEIYAERGWHFGSPPPISIKCFRIDWHSAQKPFDL